MSILRTLLTIFWLFVAVSWITNLVKFVKCDFEAPYKTEIIRSIGIPIPVVGMVTAWMDIGEENQQVEQSE